MDTIESLAQEKNFSGRLNRTYCRVCNKEFSKSDRICPICGHTLLGMQCDAKPNNLGYFIKFTDERAIQSLRSGEIWFRPPQYYRDCYSKNNNDFRGDIREFASNLGNGDLKNIEYDKSEKEKTLFCLYNLITDERGNYHFAEDEVELLRQFGDYVTLVHQKKLFKFFNLKGKCMARSIQNGNIIYYVSNLTGYVNSFFKIESYLYQHEYRFILQDEKFLKLYDGETLREEKYVYKSPFNLKKVFSRPIPVDEIFKNDCVHDWEKYVSFV